eukprot:1384424-Pyramimonas_sp.AAC.1
MCTRGGCLPRFLFVVPGASAPGQYVGGCPSTSLADGSGGKHALDERLRRCGWAVCRLGEPQDGQKSVSAVRCGSLPTPEQSSPRAELFAFL